MTQEFHRTNINLYSTDVEWLQATFGHGWTEKVREWVHQRVKEEKKWKEPRPISLI